MAVAEAKTENNVVELPVAPKQRSRRKPSVIAYANDYLLMMYVALAALPLALLLSKPGKAPGGAPVAAAAD